MATTAQSSPPQNGSRTAVLVTAPRCTREGSNGAIEVESEHCDTIEVSTNSPANQRAIASISEQHDTLNGDTTHIVADPLGEQHEEETEGFDACREYGYKYEYSEDNEESDEEDDGNDDSDRPYYEQTPIHCAVGIPASLADNLEEDASISRDESVVTYVLGKTYHPVTDYSCRRDDESSLFWFTYRCDFPRLAPYSFTTDAGWGCMLRSAQMMLGQALRMHYQTRDWRPPKSLAKRRVDPFLRRVLTWMADFPSKSENVYSLHNMVAAGIAQYQVLPGEWWGPGTVSHVLCDLCALYEEQHKQVLEQNDVKFKQSYLPGDIHRPMFRVFVTPQGTVYRDSVEELMTRDARQRRDEQHANMCADDAVDAVVNREPRDPPSHPLDPLYHLQDTTETPPPQPPPEWDTALLLLIPLRLGLKSFNQTYSAALAHVFALRQSVGVLGGRPRGARWFYGANSDGSKLYGLDPHTVQTAPHRQLVKTNVGTRVRVLAFTDEFLNSVHTGFPDEIAMSRMDPSMTLGFYCRDRRDFEDLCLSLLQWNEQHVDTPELFTVEDAVPDYTANNSSAMNEMLYDDDGFADAFEDSLDQESDEDEYVML